MARPNLENNLEILQFILDYWIANDDQNLWDNIIRIDYFEIYEDHEFVEMFRLTKPLVEELLVQIAPHLNSCKRPQGTTHLNQLLITLRYYALGATFKWIAEYMGIPKIIADRIIKDVSAAIAKIAPKHVYIHRNTTRNFRNIAHFPEVLGVIKGMHVLITPPGPLPVVSSTSINVQAVCDADLRLMHVITGWSGSAHDATIFLKSDLRARCEKGEYGNRWLLGDNAYPCKPYLLTPVMNPQKKSENRYNEAHSQTMQIIDRCFESWMRRFPVLSGVIRLSPKNSQNVIMATAVLHNICRENKLEEMPPTVSGLHMNDIHHKPSDIPESSLLNQYQERKILIDQYFSSENVAIYSNLTAEKHSNT